MTDDFRPNSDRILVKPDSCPDTTAGGLYVPEIARGGSRNGTVVAVGPGRNLQDGMLLVPPFVVGDHVVLDPVGGIPLKFGNVEYVLVRSEEILGKIS